MSNTPESPLCRMPLEQQRKVVGWLQNHTVPETVELVASEFQLKVSPGGLRRFRAWWHMTRSLELAAEFADALREKLSVNATDREQYERIREAAQIAFELAAIERHDLAAFLNLQKLRQRDKVIELARQRQQNTLAARENGRGDAAVPGCSEQDRQAILRKVDEVFGISQESVPQPSLPPSACPPSIPPAP